MFTKAIVRRPARSLVDGITAHPELGKPDYDLALRQHDAYIKALERCGLSIQVLPAIEKFPDSCFVEDVAVCTKSFALVTRPGAWSRRGEISGVRMPPTLHLKTGTSYMEEGVLLVDRTFASYPEFASFKRIDIAPEESYAANCLRVNGYVIVPAGYPKALAAVQAVGMATIEQDMSEYRKIDGGLSCLSLRFQELAPGRLVRFF